MSVALRLSIWLVVFAQSFTLVMIWGGSFMNEFALSCITTNDYGERLFEFLMIVFTPIVVAVALVKYK